MNQFIPTIIPPHPDELLYSWVIRLATANALSVPMFFEAYFGRCAFSKYRNIPVDIRRGFVSFYNAMHCEVSIPELYFNLSTLQFEMLAYPPKMQTKFINPIFRKESKVNTIKEYLLKDFRMCKACMQEDREAFGEAYIHRAHQLSGVCVCHKHHTPLFRQKANLPCIYHDDTLEPIALTDDFDKECKYADYTHFLLQHNFQSNANDLRAAILSKLGIAASHKKEAVIKVNAILGNEKPYIKQGPWSVQDYSFPIKDFVKVLMYVYPNPEDVLNELTQSSLIIEKKCEKCGKVFYTTEQALKDGWGCTFCDDKLAEVDLIKRLIKVGGNKEYVFRGFTNASSDGNNIVLYHKSCGQEYRTTLNNFIYNHKRCICNIKMQRKTAEAEMRQHSQFQLIEFNGATLPAKIYHHDCGRDFDVATFRGFLNAPRCPHCVREQGFTKENLQKEISAIVGDEYTVYSVGAVRKDKATIKHNVCGCVHDYIPYNFLIGARCPQCSASTSFRELTIMLQEYSHGRYEIIGKDREKYILRDNETNATLAMTNRLIVQEINRPTPSPLLPTSDCKTPQHSLSIWDFWYQLCVEYKDEFGHLYPTAGKYKGHDLYNWTIKARQSCKNGEFSQERIQALQEIGFVFDTDFYKWEQQFKAYKAYVAATGNYFPSASETHNGNKVGSWFKCQRKAQKLGTLNPRYAELLLEHFPDFFKVLRASKK